jgi:hypothetical protein
MIRTGHVCAKCRNGRCVDEPSEAEPLEIECPACGGDGCACCGGGWVSISQCPQRWLGGWPAQFVRYADLFKQGRGIAGSCVMDETNHFIEMYTFYCSDFDRLQDGRGEDVI